MILIVIVNYDIWCIQQVLTYGNVSKSISIFKNVKNVLKKILFALEVILTVIADQLNPHPARAIRPKATLFEICRFQELVLSTAGWYPQNLVKLDWALDLEIQQPDPFKELCPISCFPN